MTKVKKIISNFHSNIKILALKFFTILAIGKLKHFKKRLYHIHILNSGISDESLSQLIDRDSQKEAKEVMEMFHKLREEKKRNKIISAETKILCS